jgi:hypothetical protein
MVCDIFLGFGTPKFLLFKAPFKLPFEGQFKAAKTAVFFVVQP